MFNVHRVLETPVRVERDLCGRAFGRAGVTKAIVAAGHVNVCVDCLNKGESKVEKKRMGNFC